jgi:alkanesulfonate monooxygenase SsuD/methylene tetrahydromethanopterin reductase-like flavin-dependent oxidoreductase (luciferase family)
VEQLTANVDSVIVSDGSVIGEGAAMNVGVSLFFQNYADFDRHLDRGFDRAPLVQDAELYDEDLRLGDLVEPLGFDSLWTVEHHFTPYAMTAAPLHVLSYFAGRTSAVALGTMVAVLPWHEPLRLAEEISLLDHFTGDRRLLLGFGRGSSQREFGPFRIDREESRERFAESLEIIRRALTQDSFSYDGDFYQIPDVSIRPRPRSADLTESMFCAWSSPETMALAADAGLGQLFISLSSWDDAAEQAAAFNRRRGEHGWEPSAPINVVFVHCTPSAVDAQDAAEKYLPNMMDASIRHYDLLANPAIARLVADGADVTALSQGLMRQFVELNVVGTPEQCLDRLLAIQRLVGNGEFILVFKYGAMPASQAEQSMRLFAGTVLPELHALETAPSFSTPYRPDVAQHLTS